MLYSLYNLKILIDSFLKPSLILKLSSKNVNNDPIVIIVLQQNKITTNFQFNIPYSLYFKFHLLDFHNYFDEIVGLDISIRIKIKFNLVLFLLWSIVQQYIRSKTPPTCIMNVLF